jgi:lipopolysaccharide/colanic/teichoic acid biosynthesis glycosyltransferase
MTERRTRASTAILTRAIDIAVAGTALVVSLPLIVVAGAAVRCTMGPPILFRQQRLGRDGRPFTMLKLRTMRELAGAADDDARLTRLGSWLRSTSIDELPSLWNVVCGTMSIVGPRPLPVHYWDRFIGDEFVRFEVRPGLTGLAQVSGRNTVDWPERLALDVRYVRTRSLRLDLGIIARTVPMVLARRGIAAHGRATMGELRPPGTPAGESSLPS